MWLYEPNEYIIDGEWLVAEARVAFGISRRLSISAGLPILRGTGGFADSWIEGFHKALGIGNANREARPRDQFHIEIVGEDGIRRSSDRVDWQVGDMPVYATWSFDDAFGSKNDLLIAAGMTLPTGDREALSGLGDPLYGASVIAYRPIGQSEATLFGGGSVSYSAADEILGMRLNRTMWSGMAGMQYRTSPRMTWIAQFLANSPVAKSYPRFSENSYEAHVGFKRRIGERGLLTLSFVENIFRFSNSLDVGLGASYAYFW